MSRKSKDRFKLKNRYFDYLRETAEFVDPYVYNFINNLNFKKPELKDTILSRYRFGEPQLRPAQARMAFELVGGEDWKTIIPACASLEVKDTAYYCLDDVLDSGKESELVLLAGIFSSMSFHMMGELYGDIYIENVKRSINELSVLDANNFDAVMIDLNLKFPDEKLYFKKVEGYNFWENALRIGGILASASSEEIDKLGEMGKNIGSGYIVANDTWDFGKSLEDFRAGKYTLPIIYAFENTSNSDKRTLDSLFGKKYLSNEQLDEIRNIVVKSGAIDYGKKIALDFCDKGIEILNQFPDSEAKKMLEFSTTMTQRNKYYDKLNLFKIL